MIDIEEAKEFVTKFDPPEAKFALNLIAEIEQLRKDGDNHFRTAEDAIVSLLKKIKRLTERTRTIICIWCGGSVMYVDEGTAPESLVKQMKEHDLHCPSNPLQKAKKDIKELCMEIEQTTERGYARAEGIINSLEQVL